MTSNYIITGIILLAIILLVVFLMRRNIKDEKEFEKDASRSELDPEKHDKEQI